MVTKELIVKWGNPVKIRLTQAGEEMAEKIIQNRSVADAVLGDGARNNPLGFDLSSIFWTFQRKLSFFTRSQSEFVIMISRVVVIVGPICAITFTVFRGISH